MDIKEIINLRYAMPDVSLDKLRQCLTEVSYPKGFQVLEYGKVEKDIFFIKKGIVRAYTSVEGKEITFWVGKEGATIVSMKGYVCRGTADFHVVSRRLGTVSRVVGERA